MSLRSISSLLILSAVAVTPWIGGANTTLWVKGWWLAAPLALAFFLLCVQRAREGKFPVLPWPAGEAVFFLLGCLAWWMTKPEPAFPTAFSEEHWHFLETTFPFMIFQWPRFARLAFLAGVLLGFLAVLDLGASPEFRRRLRLTIGLSGLALALYALGMRWLGWPILPWINQAADTERFNVGFFHHSGPGACLNLAWPLLVFGSLHTEAPRFPVVRNVAIVLVAAAALTLWHSLAAPLIAAALLLTGVFLHARVAAAKKTSPLLIRSLIAAAFLAIGMWQWQSLQPLRVQPDGWISAAQTERDAPARDAAIRTAALKRGDRLVASTTPPRPAAWLAAARMASDYPLIGLGPGSWVKRVVLYSNDTIVNTFYQHRQFAHHDLLQTAAEWGGLGALAWLSIWLGALWRATGRRVRSTLEDPGLVLALVGLAVHSTVHSPLQNPALLLWTVVLLGLAWSTPRTAGSD
ncbi:MAG TPA: O-antigen ligase family protein [Opitutaceae bacterium]|nr:O-antigen ligase family protein [Opitutaceae bacterium]